MGQETSIAWCDHTFNPWIGCAKVSAGCRNCYAEHDTPVRVHRGRGLELWGADAARHTTGRDYWRQPIRWNAAAAEAGRRARVFCASLADVFEDHPAIDASGAREVLWELIQSTPWLDWLLLTKRPENMLRFASEAWRERWPDNVWAGTTVEDQAHADERISHLLRVPARVRFLSVEPQLEHIEIKAALGQYIDGWGNWRAGIGVSWVICGGESGHKARPFDLRWARSLRDQCSAARVPFFMKQMGAYARGEDADQTWPHNVGACVYDRRRLILSDKAGADPAEWPADLRVQEFPR